MAKDELCNNNNDNKNNNNIITLAEIDDYQNRMSPLTICLSALLNFSFDTVLQSEIRLCLQIS